MIWTILRVSPQREFSVAAELTRGLGLATYAPVDVVRLSRAGRTFERRLPLMRGYVFAGGIEGLPWSDIKATRGVAGWLTRDGDVPAFLHQSEIDRIRALEREHNQERSARPSQLGVGSRVRVTQGAFESIESLICAVRGSTATIEVPMLGSTRDIQVPLEYLAEAS
jgi:transcription antitermination factor NusG